MMLFMVVATDGRRVRDEGYAYVPIPSTPGHHSITVQTWKLAQRSILDKMRDVFLDVVPSLQDIKAVHIPTTCETEVSLSFIQVQAEAQLTDPPLIHFHFPGMPPP